MRCFWTVYVVFSGNFGVADKTLPTWNSFKYNVQAFVWHVYPLGGGFFQNFSKTFGKSRAGTTCMLHNLQITFLIVADQLEANSGVKITTLWLCGNLEPEQISQWIHVCDKCLSKQFDVARVVSDAPNFLGNTYTVQTQRSESICHTFACVAQLF